MRALGGGSNSFVRAVAEAATVLDALPDHGHAWPGRPLPVPAEVLQFFADQS